MLTIASISKICDSLAGIKTLRITDPNNVNRQLAIINTGQAYDIPIREYSGKYSTRPAKGQGGDYEEAIFTFFVPRRREELQDARVYVANRYCAVEFINLLGESVMLPRCRVVFAYDSGAVPGEDEGYTVTVTQYYNLKGYDILGSGDVAGSGSGPGTVPGTNPESPSGGGSSSTPDNPCAGFTAEIMKDEDNVLTGILTNIPDNGAPMAVSWYQDGVLVASGVPIGGEITYTATMPGTYTLKVLKGRCVATDSVPVRSQCELTTIAPYQTGNFINANIENPPPDYTVEIRDPEGAVLGSSLPFEVTETGVYYIVIIGADCERSAGIEVEVIDCDFSVTLTNTSGLLTFETDAPSGYSWVWLFESDTITPAIELSNDEAITVSKSGIYTIRVSYGTCSKEKYTIYIAPVRSRNSDNNYNFSGTVIELFNIKLSEILNPETDLLVRIGFDVCTHTEILTAEFQYKIDKINNTLTFWSGIPLSNENVYVQEL